MQSFFLHKGNVPALTTALPQGKRPKQRGPAVVKATDDDDVVALEKRVGGAKAKRAARKAKKGQDLRPFQVDAPIRDAIASGAITQAQVTEGRFISALFVIFCVCLLEGIFVGASGFLSDELDQFAQDYVYKAFSPTIALFLACSTAYGLWKTRNDPDSIKE